MTDLLAKTANISLLALAALPMIAVTLAHAEPATIKVSDLNLARTADRNVFEARIDRAADQLCSSVDLRDLSRQAACREAVRAEAVSKLPAAQAQARAAQPAAG